MAYYYKIYKNYKTNIFKFIPLFCLLASSFCIAQNRIDRPLQVQLNFSGLFLDVTGNTIADESVDKLKVNSWMPGISIGYHLNRFIYLGYSFYGPLDMTLKEEWGLSGRGLDGYIILDHKTKPIHNIEGRFSPFKFGLYASFSYTNIGKVNYQMEFTRLGNEVYIGNNSYATDLEIKWNSKNMSNVAFGLGYTHVTSSGFSFNLGLSLPVGFPDDENISIRATDSLVSILPEDISMAKLVIDEETFYGPVVFYINLGYNFKKFW